jgi:hypothetical protein
MAQWCFCVASLFFYGLATFLFFTGVQAFAPGVPYKPENTNLFDDNIANLPCTDGRGEGHGAVVFLCCQPFFLWLGNIFIFTGVQAFAPGVVPYNLKIQICSTTT